MGQIGGNAGLEAFQDNGQTAKSVFVKAKKRSARKPKSKRWVKPTTDDMTDINDFAAVIQWHPESLRRACRQGRVAGKKFSRNWRIPKEVADDILKNGIPGPS